MNVPSFDFLALVILGAAASNLSKAGWWRAAVLLAINLFFIQSFAGNLRLLIPYAGFLALGYLGVVLRRVGVRWAPVALPIAVFVVFVWLKKYLFIPHAMMLHSVYLTIGLSYVFFRSCISSSTGGKRSPAGRQVCCLT